MLRVPWLQHRKGDSKQTWQSSWVLEIELKIWEGQRGQIHRQRTREEPHTERYSETYSGFALSLQLSTDRRCVWGNNLRLKGKKKKTTRKKQAKHFLEHTWGWNSSRNLVIHKSSAWIFKSYWLQNSVKLTLKAAPVFLTRLRSKSKKDQTALKFNFISMFKNIQRHTKKSMKTKRKRKTACNNPKFKMSAMQ